MRTLNAIVRREIQRAKVLLDVLAHDFEAIDWMRWPLFKQRVDPLIMEVERALHGLRLQQIPGDLIRPLERQLCAYIRTRLRGPTL